MAVYVFFFTRYAITEKTALLVAMSFLFSNILASSLANLEAQLNAQASSSALRTQHWEAFGMLEHKRHCLAMSFSFGEFSKQSCKAAAYKMLKPLAQQSELGIEKLSFRADDIAKSCDPNSKQSSWSKIMSVCSSDLRRFRLACWTGLFFAQTTLPRNAVCVDAASSQPDWISFFFVGC